MQVPFTGQLSIFVTFTDWECCLFCNMTWPCFIPMYGYIFGAKASRSSCRWLFEHPKVKSFVMRNGYLHNVTFFKCQSQMPCIIGQVSPCCRQTWWIDTRLWHLQVPRNYSASLHMYHGCDNGRSFLFLTRTRRPSWLIRCIGWWFSTLDWAAPVLVPGKLYWGTHILGRIRPEAWYTANKLEYMSALYGAQAHQPHLAVHVWPIVIVFLPGGFPCPTVPPSGRLVSQPRGRLLPWQPKFLRAYAAGIPDCLDGVLADSLYCSPSCLDWYRYAVVDNCF